MSVTELIGDSGPALGSFDIGLVEETPNDVLGQLGYFGHVAVVDGRVDVEATGDGMLAAARYVGVLRGKPHNTPGWTLQGSGLVFWLGDEDDKGHVIESEIAMTNATLAASVAAVLPPTVTLGTVYPLADPSARYTGKHIYQSPRKALSIICAAFGVEFRVGGNFTVDVGRPDQLYPTTSRPIVSRRTGADMDVIGIGGDFDTDEGAWDKSTRILLLGQTTDEQTFATGAANAPVVTDLDPQGNPVKFTRMISESGETTGSVTARAQLHLNRFNRIARALEVTAEEFETDGTFRVGGDVWVHDPDTGIENPANELDFNGELLHPDVVRLTGGTWPVVEGMTVAFRTQTGVWLDLTRYVTFETAGSQQLTVGDLPQSLTRPGDTTISDRVDASRSATNTVAPKPPTGLTLSTTSVIDAKGNNVALITASWTAPTQNADNTVLTDLAYFEVQWHWTGRPALWEGTQTGDTSIDIKATLGLPYEVRVRAVDSTGKPSTWAIASITAAADTTAPNTPSTPTLEPYFGLLRIRWDGLDTLGNPMPSDFNRVDVHISATSGFTPSSATLAASSSTGGIVGHVNAPYGATRYVKLVAYDHGNNPSSPSAQASGATVQVAAGDIQSVNIGSVVAGTMAADWIIAGTMLTAATGARRGITPIGFQAWDASNNLIINLDGINNLLTGIFQTALSGRRLVAGAAGALGEVQLIAPDGTTSFLRGYTEVGGIEAVQFGLQIAGKSNTLWNRINYNSDEWANYRADKHHFYFGRSAGSFAVYDSTDGQGGGGVGRFTVTGSGIGMYDTAEHLRVGLTASDFLVYDAATTARLWVATGGNTHYAPNGSTRTFLANDRFDFHPGTDTAFGTAYFLKGAGNNGSAVDSPWLIFQTAGVTPGFGFYTGMLRLAANEDGTNLGIQARDGGNTSWIPLKASSFDINSDAATKTDIAPADLPTLDLVMSAPLSQYRMAETAPRRRLSEVRDQFDRVDWVDAGPDPSWTEPERPLLIGILAQEAPTQITVTDPDGGLGISLPQWVALHHGAIQELATRLAALENGGTP